MSCARLWLCRFRLNVSLKTPILHANTDQLEKFMGS